jgi:hypothetical protein
MRRECSAYSAPAPYRYDFKLSPHKGQYTERALLVNREGKWLDVATTRRAPPSCGITGRIPPGPRYIRLARVAHEVCGVDAPE